NNSVQLLDACAAKRDLRQLSAVDGLIWIDDGDAETSYDLVVRGLSWLHQLVPDSIGVHHVRTFGSQHLSHGGFAAGQPTRQSYDQAHCSANPRRIRAAFTVFDISMAMVRGPTPPGTGVIAPATSATSGCTSPTSVDPFFANSSARLGSLPKYSRTFSCVVTRLMPTSMT